jgi:hypothetical protein
MGLAVIGIRPMTFEAFIGKDGSDIKIKADDIRQVVPGATAGVVQAGHPDENGSRYQGQYGACSTNNVLFGETIGACSNPL